MREDILHKQVAQYLFYHEKQFDIKFWTYMPFGEKRNPITGSLLKTKGTKRGVPDFMVLIRNKTDKNKLITLWLECKTDNNKQTLEQIDFENMVSKFNNHFYFVIRSIDDLEDIFEFNKF